MLSSVCLWVRIGVAAQKGQIEHVVPSSVSIFAIIEQRYTVIRLRQIDPLMRANFILRKIPKRIAMSRTLQVSKLDFTACAVRANGNRERRAQHFCRLLPIYLCREIDAAAAFRQDNLLGQS